MIWLLGGYLWLYIHRPFEYWEFLGSLQIERAYMITMLAIWLVWPGKGWMPNRIHLALLAFTLVVILAWMMSPYMAEPGCGAVVENLLKVAVFYLLVVTSVRDEKGLRLLLMLYLVAVALYMGHSLLEYHNGRIQYRQGFSRMIGVDITYGDPNAFASTLVYTLPLTLPFWLDRPRMHTRLLLGGFVLLACTCILLTGSRSGFIGLCAAALLTLLFFSRNKARVVLLAGGGGVLALLLLTLALPTELQHRYLTLIDSSYGPKNAQVSAEGRIDGLIAGVQAWQRSPVIGHGPGAFTFATGRDLQAHNLYGQVLSEVGVLGVLGLLGLLYCFWHNTFEATRLAPHARGRARPFAALVSRCIALDILLLLLLGCAGHNLYRYQWQWFAAFQVIALHCLRTQPLAQVARTSPGYLVHRRGPHWVPLQG